MVRATIPSRRTSQRLSDATVLWTGGHGEAVCPQLLAMAPFLYRELGHNLGNMVLERLHGQDSAELGTL